MWALLVLCLLQPFKDIFDLQKHFLAVAGFYGSLLSEDGLDSCHKSVRCCARVKFHNCMRLPGHDISAWTFKEGFAVESELNETLLF